MKIIFFPLPILQYKIPLHFQLELPTKKAEKFVNFMTNDENGGISLRSYQQLQNFNQITIGSEEIRQFFSQNNG